MGNDNHGILVALEHYFSHVVSKVEIFDILLDMHENGPERLRAVGRKYAEIDRGGRSKIDIGEVKEFTGFSEAFERRTNIWLEFTHESTQTIIDRVSRKIEEIERETGIKFYLAGRDFPIHSSLKQGEVGSDGKLTEEDREILVTRLSEDKQLQDSAQQLEGKLIEFKYLLFAGGDAILTCTDIPEEIDEIRKQATKSYAEQAVDSIDPAQEILHMTIARMTEMQKDNELKGVQLLQYKRRMIELRHEISSNPLSLVVSGVNISFGGVAKGGISKQITTSREV